MPYVYILFSKKINRYYIGSCLDVHTRYHEHISKVYPNSFTSKVNDWILAYFSEVKDLGLARKIERHIKSMKSSNYIRNLMQYPEIMNTLIDRYSAGSCR